MAITSYPGGFRGGSLIKEVPMFDQIPGNVLWVSSTTGGAGNPGTFNRPLSTIAGALLKCSANNGDVIFCKPGHAETISAAAGIVLNVAGVRIVGIGQGASRPTITWSATASTMTCSAANMSLENFALKAGIASVVIGINLLAGSTDFRLDRCSFYVSTSTFCFVTTISTTSTNNAHDGLTVTRCEVSDASTANVNFVSILGNIDRFVFEDNVITMGVSDNGQVIAGSSKALTAISVQRNTVYRGSIASTAESGDIFIGTSSAANTGVIANNMIGHLDPLAESIINVTGAQNFNNLSCGVVDKSGYLLPGADS